MNIQSLPFGLRSSFYDPTVVQILHFWHKSWDRIISDTTLFFHFMHLEFNLVDLSLLFLTEYFKNISRSVSIKLWTDF